MTTTRDGADSIEAYAYDLVQLDPATAAATRTAIRRWASKQRATARTLRALAFAQALDGELEIAKTKRSPRAKPRSQKAS